MSHLKKAVSRSLAATVVAMGLAGGMALQEAAPAEAFLFVAPIAAAAISGGTATAGAGATVGGALAVAGILAAVGGAGMALTRGETFSITFPWDDDANPYRDTDADGVKKDVVADAVPKDNGSDLSTVDQDFIWGDSSMTAKLIGRSADKRSLIIDYTASATGNIGASTRLAAYFETKCRNPSTGVITRHQSIGGAYTWYSTTQGKLTYRNSTAVACPTGSELLTATVRAPSTYEKEVLASGAFKMGTNQYQNHKGPRNVIFFKSQDADYETPMVRTVVECVNSAGQVNKLTVDSPATGGQIDIPSCAEAGLGVAKSIVSNFLDGGKVSGAPLLDIHHGDAAFTECDVALGKICKMEIFIDGMPCAVGLVACVSWLGLQRVSPGRVECRYGGKVVDISGCFILEGAYVPGGTPAISENTDGDPDTWIKPGTIPGWQPRTPADPYPTIIENPSPTQHPGPNPAPAPEAPMEPDPEWKPEPNPGTNPNPGTEPGTGTDPGTGTGTGTGGFPAVGTNPSVDTNPKGESCLSSAWSWNPVDWVLVPVKCAFTWAFVPKVNVQARISEMAIPFEGKVPFAWFDTGASPIGGGGCPTSWAITLRGETHSLICGTAADGIIQGFRPVLGAMLIAAALWPLIRSLFYASIPVFKVTPS